MGKTPVEELPPKPKQNGDGNLVIYLIEGLFLVGIVCLTFLKYQNPDVDATFLGIMISLIMSMAGFLVLHFNQRRVADAVVETAKELKQDNKDVAEQLRQDNSTIVDKQTEKVVSQVVTAMGEKTKEIVEKVETQFPTPPPV